MKAVTDVIVSPLQERGPPNLGFGNMTGGFMMGGQAGTLKMTLPTAFTISMLAWSMLEFPQVCAHGSSLAGSLHHCRLLMLLGCGWPSTKSACGDLTHLQSHTLQFVLSRGWLLSAETAVASLKESRIMT